MPSRAAAFLFAAALCITPAALVAQEQQAPPLQAPAPAQTQPARNTAGPRLQPPYTSYEPAIARDSGSVTTAAAADRTTITISTLALVLLIVLVVLLIT